MLPLTIFTRKPRPPLQSKQLCVSASLATNTSFALQTTLHTRLSPSSTFFSSSSAYYRPQYQNRYHVNHCANILLHNTYASLSTLTTTALIHHHLPSRHSSWQSARPKPRLLQVCLGLLICSQYILLICFQLQSHKPRPLAKSLLSTTPMISTTPMLSTSFSSMMKKHPNHHRRSSLPIYPWNSSS